MSAPLHVRDGELDSLMLGDRPAERDALLRIAHALVDAALSQPSRQRGYRYPSFIERLQELRIAAAALAQQVLLGHAARIEEQLVGVRGTPANLGVFRCAGQTGRFVRHNY